MDSNNADFQQASKEYIANGKFPNSPSHRRPMTWLEKVYNGLSGKSWGVFIDKYTGEEFDFIRLLSTEEKAAAELNIIELVARNKVFNERFPKTELGYNNGHSAYDTFVHGLYFKYGYTVSSIVEDENNDKKITSTWEHPLCGTLTVESSDELFTYCSFPYQYLRKDDKGKVSYDMHWQAESKLCRQIQKSGDINLQNRYNL